MRIDALVLRAVAGELQRQLVGARIDTVIAPTPQAVALQCYVPGKNHWLLISAHPQLARLHLLPGRPQKLVTDPSTFIMLLRKYLENGRIEGVTAVRHERIVELYVRGHEGPVTLIAEVMGNLANIILVNNANVVLGALHQFGHSVNRYRTMLPGQPYLAPPPQMRALAGETLPRLEPEQVTADDLRQAAHEGEPQPAWRILLQHIAGLSPDAAQETLCRAVGSTTMTLTPDAPEWDAIAQRIRDLARIAANDAWEPVAILDADGQIADGALLPPCRDLQRPMRRMDSVNDLLAAYFVAREWRDALGSASQDIRRTLKTAHDRLRKKLRALHDELAALAEGDRLRDEGELLLAYASDIPPNAKTYILPDVGDGRGALTVTLDPQLTAVENANARFTRYHKMRRAAQQIPEQITRAETDLARVAQLLTDLDLADTLADLTHVRAEVKEARFGMTGREDERKPGKMGKAKGNLKGKGQTKARAGGEPLRFTSGDGFTMWVGKNSQQNEHVTFDIATGNDLWLHARGVPGAHVIVKSGGRPVPQTTIEEAASLAAWYSGSRTAGNVPVDYTEQRYVRHMKDGGPGMVIYVKEKTVPAVPRELSATPGKR